MSLIKCDVCGNFSSETLTVCPSCSAVIRSEQPGTHLAPLADRLFAHLIDSAIIAMLILPGIFIPGARGLGVVGVYIAFIYYAACDGLPHGQSLGKRVLGISVVYGDAKSPCGLIRSIARNCTKPLGILDLIFLFGENRQRLGDHLASTTVIKVKKS